MVFYDIMVVLDNNHGYILPEGVENCKRQDCFVSFAEADFTQATWQAHSSCIDRQTVVSASWLFAGRFITSTCAYFLCGSSRRIYTQGVNRLL